MEAVMGQGEAEAGEILPERDIDMSAAYNMLASSKASVEEIVSQLLSFKKDPDTSSSKISSQFRELVTQILLNFVILRQANRSILLEEDRVKAETERAKAPVDFTTLQLHNLMYEKSHYLKAIKACRDFKSKYPDIELVHEDEFFRDAPEDIKNSVISNDTAHNLMLTRLNFELYQRKQLCELREKLEQQKKSLLETISNRKKFLSSLPSHLKSLKKASLPIQQQLGIQHTKKLKQQQSAELLPPPLYVTYSQLLAQKEAFGENIDVEVSGSLKDAQAFVRQLAAKDTGISTNLESSRLEDDVPDEEDDGQRRRKRPKKVPTKDNLDQGGVYQTHPLKVVLHIYDDKALDTSNAKLASLKFEYLVKLNVVSVGVESSQDAPDNSFLCNLFPDDTGLELPQQSAKILLGDDFKLDESRSSRPYKWAQHLAGIDFLPEVSPLLATAEISSDETANHVSIQSGLSVYRQQHRVKTVVQRIRARKKAQLVLSEQLDSLANLNWPVLTSRDVPWASHSPICSLHDWSLLGSAPNDTPSLPSTGLEDVQGPLDVEIDEKSGASKDEVENTREDGELPSLVSAAAFRNVLDVVAPSKGSDLELLKLPLVSKTISTPGSKAKSTPSKKFEEEMNFLFDYEDELDEPVVEEPEMDDALATKGPDVVDDLWADYGVNEYCLSLTRKSNNSVEFNLVCKIKISKEYPVRPPLFALKLNSRLQGKNYSEPDISERYNELRAMEAEVNVHLVKSIPFEQENLVLAHQVRCVAMLFDFYMEDGGGSSVVNKGGNTCVIDVGLCKPASGGLVARSFRGRDRRKMISWKDNICTPGYPY